MVLAYLVQVYTARGAELARVTVINEESKVVYEAFVKPPFPVVSKWSLWLSIVICLQTTVPSGKKLVFVGCFL